MCLLGLSVCPEWTSKYDDLVFFFFFNFISRLYAQNDRICLYTELTHFTRSDVKDSQNIEINIYIVP
jgi:hypothetical protein